MAKNKSAAKKKTTAKKTKKKINKSEAIRKYDKQHSDSTASEVVAALAKKGIKIVPTQVYNVRAKSTKKKPARKSGRPKGKRQVSSAKVSAPDASALEAAASLVKQTGGVEEAREALKALERITKALE